MIPTRPDVEYTGNYTQAQAAKALGIDRHTIARYIKQGRLKSQIRKVDRRVIIKGRDILHIWCQMII